MDFVLPPVDSYESDEYDENGIFVNLDTNDVEQLSPNYMFSQTSTNPNIQQVIDRFSVDSEVVQENTSNQDEVAIVSESISPTSKVVVKSRKFKYTDAHDILILQEIKKIRAHIAPHGEVAIRFNEVSHRLNASKKFCGKQWSIKGVQERYSSLKKVFKQNYAVERKLSGCSDTLTEKDSLLEELIEHENCSRAEKNSYKEEERKRVEEKERFGRIVLDLTTNRKEKRKHDVMDEVKVLPVKNSNGTEECASKPSNVSEKPTTTKTRRVGGLKDLFDDDFNEINRTIAQGDKERNVIREKEVMLAERKFEAHQEQLRLERIERSEERKHAREMHMQTMQLMMEVVKNSQNVTESKKNDK